MLQFDSVAFARKHSYGLYFLKRGRFADLSKRAAVPLPVVIVALICSVPSLGQDLVDNVTAVSLSSTSTRLKWDPVESVECETSVTYSVFRGTTEDFTPSPNNRVANGLTRTTYVATEPVAGKDYYYYVTAEITPILCTPHSGTIVVYPVDLRETFEVSIGTDFGTCIATSTSEISCNAPISASFHAAIAAQSGHEYLIGCRSADFEEGDWTCANLTSGVYHVGVHSQTLTIWDSGLSKVNIKTGKTLSPITPVFSVLARLK